jgi:hypothetical protein
MCGAHAQASLRVVVKSTDGQRCHGNSLASAVIESNAINVHERHAELDAEFEASAGDEYQPRVQAPEVAHVARHHRRSVAAGEERNARVNDIRAVSEPAQHAGGSRLVEIERSYAQDSRVQEASEAGLTRSVAPDLCHDARGHMERRVVRRGELDQAAQATVAALEGDKRAAIED